MAKRGNGRPSLRFDWRKPRIIVPGALVVVSMILAATANGWAGFFGLVAALLAFAGLWTVAGGTVPGVNGRRVGAAVLAIGLVGFIATAAAADNHSDESVAAPSLSSTTAPSASLPAKATPTPTPTPTQEDLTDPDDPALNDTAAAALTAPQAAPVVDVPATFAQAEGQTALVALESLGVNDNPSMAGYSRDLFGYRAVDLDRNGCDTRNDILGRDLVGVAYKSGTNNCVVLTGNLSDPYSGTAIAFVRGTTTSNAVQIDHVVALGDAWASGAAGWDTAKLQQFGNDPLNLLAVSGPLNDQKGDKNAAGWLPPNTNYRCSYVARQIGVKFTYGLTVTNAERDAMAGVLSTCVSAALPSGSTLPAPMTKPTPTTAPVVPAAPKPAAPPATKAPVTPAKPAAPAAPSSVYYANCAAARAAGAAPLYAGQPGYRAGLDRDHDGIACES